MISHSELFVNKLKEKISEASYPTDKFTYIKWIESRVYEITESHRLENYRKDEIEAGLVNITDRSELGFWVEWEVRKAVSDTELTDCDIDKEKTYTRSVLKTSDLDNKSHYIPFISYGIRFRPNQMIEAIELINSGKVPEKKEGYCVIL